MTAEVTVARRMHVFVDAENLSVERLPPCVLPAQLTFTLILGKTCVRARWEDRFEGTSATLRVVQMHSGGPNAMDFLLAFYVGEAVSASSGSVDVIIVSRDKGFDPLVQHLVGRSIRSRRVESLDFLPIVLHVNAMSLAERAAYAATKLQEFGSCSRPLERCMRMLDRVFQHCLPPEALQQVLHALLDRGVLRRSGDGHAVIFP